MRNNGFLSPLLITTFCCFLLLANVNTYAQVEKDSIYYYQLILTPKTSSDLSEGVEYYSRKKEKFLLNNDTLGAIQTLRMIAIGQKDAGMIYDSQTSAIEALSLLDNFQAMDESIQEAKLGLYNHLGLIYRILKDYPNAIRINEKAMGITLKSKDSIILLNNIGLIYKNQGDFLKAEEYYTESLKKAKDHEDSRLYARVLNNLATVQLALNREETLIKLKEALQIRLSESESLGIYSSYIALSEYFKEKDKEKAIQYAEQAYDLSKIISPRYEVNALKHLLQLRPSEKIEDYIRLTDSISDAKLVQENKFAGIKYNLSEEKARTQASELQREKEKSAKITTRLISGFLILLLLLIGIFYRIKGKKDIKLKVFDTEYRISKKVHDEVANDIFHVMTKIQTQNLEKEALLDDLEVIYNKTRDISRESSPVELDEDFQDQLQDLLQSYQSDETTVMTQNISSVSWENISDEKKISIYRVLQELMTNMKKHSQATVVHLSFNSRKKDIIIKYSDNGIGTDLKNKNGLQHVENRIEAIKGSIIFDTEPNRGFKAIITV